MNELDVIERFARVGKPKIEQFEIGGETFHIRGMGSHQRAIFLQCVKEAAIENSEVPDHVVVALGLCAEDGSPLGEMANVIEKIRGLDGALLYRTANRIIDLSGLGKKAVDAAEKN